MNKQIAIAGALLLIVGAAAGYWLGTSRAPAPDGMAMSETTSAKPKPLFYRSPMNPQVTSPVPKKDAMGMDYVAVYADDAAASGSTTVAIDPVTVQSIGVRSTKAQRQTLTHTIQTVGRVDYDEQRLTRLHPRTDGWIEKLYVNETGQFVDQGTILLGIYSPQLVAAQQEFLLALKNLRTLGGSPYPDIAENAKDLAEIARKRLELLEVPQHQIAEIENSGTIMDRLHIHSPYKGAVLKVGVREGQHVTPRTELYEIADLSKVWVMVDIYEYELPWVTLGDKATMTVDSLPGRQFEGSVTYIYPYFENHTRTVKARLEFDNRDFVLKPDTYANITVHSSRQLDAIVIPAEAVIRSGAGEQVLVARGGGKFEPRDVVLGVTSKGLVQVVDGLEAGEAVVTSGQFLIDSESQLREAVAKMREVSSPAEEGMAGMDKDAMDKDGKDGDPKDHEND